MLPNSLATFLIASFSNFYLLIYFVINTFLFYFIFIVVVVVVVIFIQTIHFVKCISHLVEPFSEKRKLLN